MLNPNSVADSGLLVGLDILMLSATCDGEFNSSSWIFSIIKFTHHDRKNYAADINRTEEDVYEINDRKSILKIIDVAKNLQRNYNCFFNLMKVFSY